MHNPQSHRQLMLPFRVKIAPMEKLLVANFEDPEFDGIEPQVFDDPVNGKGMKILRYRKDGRVDVYWQPGVKVDRETFTLGAGIGDFMETTIEPARFEITERGVDLHLAFTDAQDRSVELRLSENAPGKRSFPLLAPVGDDIADPLELFLVYMPEIDFVRRAGTVVEGRIGDRGLIPASLPILRQGRRVLLMRYAAKPVIGVLNPPMSQPIIAELTTPGSVEIDGMSIAVDANGTITRLSAGEGTRRAEVHFYPGFPNLLDLIDGGSSSGRFSIRVSGIPITGGAFEAVHRGERVAVELDLLEHWKPTGLPLSIEILTRVLSMFRTWPSTYRWQGTVELGREPAMSGKWMRKIKR